MFSIERAGDHVVVWLTGDVDLSVRGEVLASYEHAIALIAVPDLVVDVSEVTFMDSTGLSTLAAAPNKILALGGAISVVGASERIMKLFRIVHPDEVITVIPADRVPPRGAGPRTREEVG